MVHSYKSNHNLNLEFLNIIFNWLLEKSHFYFVSLRIKFKIYSIGISFNENHSRIYCSGWNSKGGKGMYYIIILFLKTHIKWDLKNTAKTILKMFFHCKKPLHIKMIMPGFFYWTKIEFKPVSISVSWIYDCLTP